MTAHSEGQGSNTWEAGGLQDSSVNQATILTITYYTEYVSVRSAKSVQQEGYVKSRPFIYIYNYILIYNYI